MNRLKLAGIEKAPSPNLVIGSDSNGNTTWQKPSGGWGSKPLTPTNQRPINGEVNIIENPLFESTDFAHPFGLSMYGYQLVIKEGETVVYDSGNLELTITKFQIPKGKIVTGTTYSWSVRYQDHQLNWSDWSAPTSFTTQAVFGAGSVDTPFLLLPTNGSALNSPYPLMLGSTWGSTGNLIPGDSTFEISRDPSFATVIESVTLNSRVFQSTLAYPRGEVFCARMKDRATTGEESSWSSMSCFSVRTLYREQRIGIVLTDPINWIFQRVDRDFNRVEIDDDYWLSNAIYQGLTMSAGTLLFGQEMSVLPAFWVNSGIVPTGPFAGMRFWMLDPTTPSQIDRDAGWHRHDAFYNPSGGFQDSLPISSNLIRNVGSIAVSTPTGTPYTPTTTTEIKTLINARNTNPDALATRGWHLLNYAQFEAIKLLMLIEYGGTSAAYIDIVKGLAPYRGVHLFYSATHGLCIDGLRHRSATLRDGITTVTIPPLTPVVGDAKIQSFLSFADGTPTSINVNDYLIPHTTVGSTVANIEVPPNGKIYLGATPTDTRVIPGYNGFMGYSFDVNGSMVASMCKFD